ncbi:hypothetical protein [Acanthopleuribacter pedis]|uniref:Secreted protein n=1 Tax=Acanthopleuribacter pedis TaxID=442870 RepID=A0A8J7U764_9BACT|nr:hypothetical protein [Acanthopleuribacter pedis]MBO1322168.1 hypothetical protein [Acanthopleuribacter pedis]
MKTNCTCFYLILCLLFLVGPILVQAGPGRPGQAKTSGSRGIASSGPILTVQGSLVRAFEFEMGDAVGTLYLFEGLLEIDGHEYQSMAGMGAVLVASRGDFITGHQLVTAGADQLVAVRRRHDAVEILVRKQGLLPFDNPRNWAVYAYNRETLWFLDEKPATAADHDAFFCALQNLLFGEPVGSDDGWRPLMQGYVAGSFGSVPFFAPFSSDVKSLADTDPPPANSGGSGSSGTDGSGK